MPYVDPIPPDEAAGALRREYDAAVARSGRIWNIVSIMSHNPEVLRESMRMYRSVMFGSSPLTRAQREMLAVVTSQANGCDY